MLYNKMISRGSISVPDGETPFHLFHCQRMQHSASQHMDSSSKESMSTGKPKNHGPSCSLDAPDTENLTALTRLGKSASTIILLGWVVEILVITFLVYLWTGPGSDTGGSYATTFWRWIMLNDLAAQATTIASMIIRTALSLQATVCTALTAAVLLESRVVRMSDIPLFSVLRAVNGGPSSIVEPLIWTPRRLFGSIPTWLVLILFLTAISSELTSTLLLVDFRKASLLDGSITNATAIIETSPELLLFPANETDRARSWRSAPSTYPPFGEIQLRASKPLPGQRGTGTIKRAFLPFNAHGRQRLRKYSGPALTYTSEVLCSRPVISGSIYYTPGRLKSYWPRIKGTVSWQPDSDFPDPCGPGGEPCGPLPFDCAMPFTQNETQGVTYVLDHRPTSLCLFNQTDQRIRYSRNFTNIFLAIDTPTNVTDLLILNIDTFRPTTNSNVDLSGPDFPPPTNVGEWASYEFGPNVNYRMSVCQSYMGLWLNYIEAETPADTKEPSLTFDPVSGVWIMDDIVDMMGHNKSLSDAERGIMTITNTSAVSSQDLQQMFSTSINFDALSVVGVALEHLGRFISYIVASVKGGVLTSQGDDNFTIYFCSQCDMNGNYLDPDSTYTLLFHAILDKTDSIAPAYDSIIFWMTQALYYKALPGFDFRGNATMVYSTVVSIPRAWTGLTTVLCLTILNMVCVAAITWLFLSRTQYSIYGDTWHTIAQIVSPDTRNMLERATQSSDKDARKVLKNAGSADVEAGLYKLHSGRVVVLRNNAPFRHMEVHQ